MTLDLHYKSGVLASGADDGLVKVWQLDDSYRDSNDSRAANAAGEVAKSLHFTSTLPGYNKLKVVSGQ